MKIYPVFIEKKLEFSVYNIHFLHFNLKEFPSNFGTILKKVVWKDTSENTENMLHCS
jgi:hypothetical protein